MIRRLMLGVMVAGLCASGAALAKDTPSQAFIAKAIQGNYAEIEMGKLAQSQGASQDVKAFGQTLQKDHGDANTKAIAAANSLGVTPPSGPNAMQVKEHDRMAKMSGPAFDKTFAKHMVAGHKTNISAYTKASKMKTADAASQYASETLPVLNMHLETAQALAKK
jgi:putative membrane protein